jgi:glutathione S-transferase
MITLYTFGRRFGLPDPSPFVTKAEILLLMSGLEFRLDTSGFAKAPKGKLPYINDDGTIVADSTFIRWHLEHRHGIDFDQGLSAAEMAAAWAFEKMCEEHLYWALVDSRWMVKPNFDKGPRAFFDGLSSTIRPFVIAAARRKVGQNLKAQGIGRHTRADIERLATVDLDAISAFLGTKSWLMGDAPCGADASVWSFVANALCPHFATSIRTAAERYDNLLAYRNRGLARWFPDLT